MDTSVPIDSLPQADSTTPAVPRPSARDKALTAYAELAELEQARRDQDYAENVRALPRALRDLGFEPCDYTDAPLGRLYSCVTVALDGMMLRFDRSEGVQLRGECPRCSQAGWSYRVRSLARLGELLVQFQADEHTCPRYAAPEPSDEELFIRSLYRIIGSYVWPGGHP